MFSRRKMSSKAHPITNISRNRFYIGNVIEYMETEGQFFVNVNNWRLVEQDRN